MKKGCAILFLFLASLLQSQNSMLLQNVNYRAKELKHHLDKSGDTLTLKGERMIEKVEIFNNDFEKIYPINSNETQISLSQIPEGRYVVEVKIEDKLIIITLIRHKALETHLQQTLISNKDEKASSNTPHKAESKATVSIPAHESKFLKKEPIRNVKFYWIVKDINKGHSSSKVMRIGDKSVVERMIAQNKIDLKSKAGKRNVLTIWEVYDTSEFMKLKHKNPDYANIEQADCFNVVPFYESKQKE